MAVLPIYKTGAVFAGYWDAYKGTLPPAPQQDTFWIINREGVMDNVFYETGTALSYFSGQFWKTPGNRVDFSYIANAPETVQRWAKWGEVQGKPVGTNLENNLVQRDSLGDAEARLWKSKYPSQTEIPKGASLSFRVNTEDDYFIRFADRDAVVKYLGQALDSAKLEGKNLDEVRALSRNGVVLDTITINNKRLNQNINLNAADVGLGDVPNYPATNSAEGTSTSLLATQRSAYNAGSAPHLADDRKRKITVKQTEPTGSDGEDGDIWLVY